jgi:chlorobactene glucosyltransferase
MALPLPPLLSLPWLLPWAVLPLLARRRPALAEVPRASGRLVSIIVPARNESANLAGHLESLLRSNYAPFEVIVVDDQSTDDTAALAAAVAARDARVRLVRGGDLPAGWYGKPWACVQGFRQARGDLLLFTDADTRHGPDLLEHAVGALETRGADLVSLLAHQECLTFWERVIMPQVWAPLGARFHPLRVNAARRARDVIAAGQFILTSRDAYEQVGTHDAVKGQVAEDLALAHAYHRRGLRVTLWWAEDMLRTRMYTSLDQIVEGWAKNLHLGGRASFPDEPLLRAALPLALLGGQVFWLWPTLALAWTGGARWAFWAWAMAAGFWAVVSAGMRIPPWYGLLHPVGAFATLAIILRSTLRGGRRVVWRGRTYRH